MTFFPYTDEQDEPGQPVRKKITAEERALIDEAIAAGRVTVCPPQSFLDPASFVYDPISRRLVYADGKDHRAGVELERARRTDGPQINRRRAKVRIMLHQGVSVKDIAASLEVSVSTVQTDKMYIEVPG